GPALLTGQPTVELLAEVWIEDVVELAPIAFGAFQAFGLEADRRSVRGLSHQVDVLVRPVRDRVDPPAPEAFVRPLGEELLEVRPILPQEIGPAEIIRSVGRVVLVVAVRGPTARSVESGIGRVGDGQVSEIGLAIADRR